MEHSNVKTKQQGSVLATTCGERVCSKEDIDTPTQVSLNISNQVLYIIWIFSQHHLAS